MGREALGRAGSEAGTPGKGRLRGTGGLPTHPIAVPRPLHAQEAHLATYSFTKRWCMGMAHMRTGSPAKGGVTRVENL